MIRRPPTLISLKQADLTELKSILDTALSERRAESAQASEAANSAEVYQALERPKSKIQGTLSADHQLAQEAPRTREERVGVV